MRSKACEAALKAVAEAEAESPRRAKKKDLPQNKKQSACTKRKKIVKIKTAAPESRVVTNPESVAKSVAEDSGETGNETARALQASDPVKEPDSAWMNFIHANEPVINDNELISLTALIAYVAHMTGQAEFRVERQFADRFNIPNVKCLPVDRYDDAVRYLVERVPVA